jgi:hypothetical protein
MPIRWEPSAENWLMENAGCLNFLDLCRTFRFTAAKYDWHPRSDEAIGLKLNRLGLSRVPEHDHFDVATLAKDLGVSAARVKRWMRLGLPARRHGQRWIIKVSALGSYFLANPDMTIGIDHDRLYWLLGDDCEAILQRRTRHTGIAQPVWCVETGERFPSLQAAAERVFVTRKSLNHAAIHGTVSAGYHWSFVEPQQEVA